MSLKSSQSQLNLSNGFKKRLLRPVSTHKQNDPKSSMKNSNLLSLHDHITIKNKYVEAKIVLQSIQESLMKSNNSKVHNITIQQSSSQQNVQSSQKHENTLSLSLQKLIFVIKQKKQKQQSIKTQTSRKSISTNSTKSIQVIMSEVGAKNLQQGLKVLYMQSQQVQQFLQQVLYILAIICNNNYTNTYCNNNYTNTQIRQTVDLQHVRVNENEQKPLVIAKLLTCLIENMNNEQNGEKQINKLTSSVGQINKITSCVRNVQQFTLAKLKPIISYEDVQRSKQLFSLRKQLKRQKQINNELQNHLKSLVNKSQENDNKNNNKTNNNNKNNNKTNNRHQQTSTKQIQTIHRQIRQQTIHRQIRQVYQQSLSIKDELIVKLKSDLLFCQQKLSKQQSIANISDIANIANISNAQSKQKQTFTNINKTNSSNNINNEQKQFMLTLQQQFEKMRHGFNRKFEIFQQQHIQKQQTLKKQLFTLQRQLQNIHRENTVLYKKYQFILNNNNNDS